MRTCLNRLALLALLAVAAAAQQPFQILTTHIPVPQQGESYKVQLQATGGQPPYTWRVAQGKLPEGLSLDPQSGEISGLPRTSKPFSVLIAVADSSQPPLEETRLLPSSASAPLTIKWTQKPQVRGQDLNGALEVSNHSGQTIALTVIVVAVAADTHKAFSLRYTHQELANQKSTDELPFTVFLPPGAYTINVDAVGEVSKDIIYRQHQEVAGLAVPSSSAARAAGRRRLRYSLVYCSSFVALVGDYRDYTDDGCDGQDGPAQPVARPMHARRCPLERSHATDAGLEAERSSIGGRFRCMVAG